MVIVFVFHLFLAHVCSSGLDFCIRGGWSAVMTQNMAEILQESGVKRELVDPAVFGTTAPPPPQPPLATTATPQPPPQTMPHLQPDAGAMDKWSKTRWMLLRQHSRCRCNCNSSLRPPLLQVFNLQLHRHRHRNNRCSPTTMLHLRHHLHRHRPRRVPPCLQSRRGSTATMSAILQPLPKSRCRRVSLRNDSKAGMRASANGANTCDPCSRPIFERRGRSSVRNRL